MSEVVQGSPSTPEFTPEQSQLRAEISSVQGLLQVGLSAAAQIEDQALRDTGHDEAQIAEFRAFTAQQQAALTAATPTTEPTTTAELYATLQATQAILQALQARGMQIDNVDVDEIIARWTQWQTVLYTELQPETALTTRSGGSLTVTDRVRGLARRLVQGRTGSGGGLMDPRAAMQQGYTPEEVEAALRVIRQITEALATTFGEVAAVEALGDARTQEWQVRVAVLHRRLLATGYTPEALAAMSPQELVKALASVEQLVRQAEQENLTLDAAQVEALTGARTSLATQRVRAARRAGGAEVAAARAEGEATHALARVSHEAEVVGAQEAVSHRARLLAVAAELENVEAAGKQRAALGAVDRQHAVAVAAHELPRVNDELQLEGDEQLHGLRRTLEILRGPFTTAVTAMTQGVSGYLSILGMASMASTVGMVSAVAKWGIAIPFGGGINALLYILTRGHQQGAWRFLTEPERPTESDSWSTRLRKRVSRRPTFNGMGYVFIAFLSFLSNQGGALGTFTPTKVVQTAAGEQLEDTVAWVADAREAMAPGAEATNGLIVEVQQAGRDLYNESVARGASGQYGFRVESRRKLVAWEAAYRDAADKLGASGDCEGLKKLEKVYEDFYALLNNEYARGGARYASSGFDASTGDLDANIDTCLETNPQSAQALADDIQATVERMRGGIESGEITDPSALNPDIHRINRSILLLAEMTNTEALELSEMDPLMFEALKVTVASWQQIFKDLGQAMHLIEVTPNEQRAALYPAIMSLFSAVVDQFGLILSFILIAGQRRYTKKLLQTRAAHLSGTTQVEE